MSVFVPLTVVAGTHTLGAETRMMTTPEPPVPP